VRDFRTRRALIKVAESSPDDALGASGQLNKVETAERRPGHGCGGPGRMRCVQEIGVRFVVRYGDCGRHVSSRNCAAAPRTLTSARWQGRGDPRSALALPAVNWPLCQPLPRRAAGRTGQATGPRFTAAVPVRRRRSTSAGLRRTTFAPVPPPTADCICRRFSRTVHGLVVSRSSMRNGRSSIVAVCASATAPAARSARPTGAILPAAPVSIGRLRCGRLPRLLEGLCANTPTRPDGPAGR
jgi:hypothetical protein